MYIVNHLLFVTTLFRNLLLIDWFATTKDSDQALSRPIFLLQQRLVRNEKYLRRQCPLLKFSHSNKIWFKENIPYSTLTALLINQFLSKYCNTFTIVGSQQALYRTN